MAEWLEITEENRDEWSRRGIYLFLGTRLSYQDDLVHCEEGPAILTPDGVERWYVHGEEITAEVKTLFQDKKWKLADGLDTQDKISLFKATFVDRHGSRLDVID